VYEEPVPRQASFISVSEFIPGSKHSGSR
jgi:hypothetical protein